MLPDQLKSTIVVRGPIFPEPVQVILAIPVGASVKLVGKGLAQALSALYPPGTDEKRWVDGVLARKKGLGF